MRFGLAAGLVLIIAACLIYIPIWRNRRWINGLLAEIGDMRRGDAIRKLRELRVVYYLSTDDDSRPLFDFSMFFKKKWGIRLASQELVEKTIGTLAQYFLKEFWESMADEIGKHYSRRITKLRRFGDRVSRGRKDLDDFRPTLVMRVSSTVKTERQNRALEVGTRVWRNLTAPATPGT